MFDSVAIIQITASFFGTMGFCFLFNIRGNKLWLAALGGMLSWLLFLSLESIVASEGIRYFLVSVCSTIYAEILARKVKCPATVFLVTGMVPLIPGSALYYTMNYALNEQWDLFMKKAFYTLELALALALGIIAVTTAARLITLLIRYGKKQACRHFHHSI